MAEENWTRLSQVILNEEEGNELVSLYGTIPPATALSEDKAAEMTRGTSESLRELKAAAGYIVYHLQDEPGRNGQPRPFAFRPGSDPLDFVQQVHQHLQQPSPAAADSESKPLSALLFQVTSALSKAAFHRLVETIRQEVSHPHPSIGALTLVGPATSSPSSSSTSSSSTSEGGEQKGYSLAEASRLIVEAVGKSRLALGGLLLPERHLSKGDEPQRMIAKQRDAGISFFTTQVIYDVELLISVLESYLTAIDSINQAQSAEGSSPAAPLKPATIILTFAPISQQKTVDFLSWLGVRVPSEIAAQILAASDPASESVAVCCRHFAQVLARFFSPSSRRCKIGFSVETVTGFRKERDASVLLFQQLTDLYHQSFLS